MGKHEKPKHVHEYTWLRNDEKRGITILACACGKQIEVRT